MPLLTVVLVPGPDQVVVRLTGEADLSTAPLIADALAQATQLGTRQIVVDVAAARFWDCSGLHALVACTGDLATEGRGCRVVGAPGSTRRLIELANLADELNVDGVVRALPAPNVSTAPSTTTGDDFSAVTGRPACRPAPDHPLTAAVRTAPVPGAVAVGTGWSR
jgi:anti-anti-sigma factor